MNKFLRQWLMLQKIPRSKKRTSTEELEEYLREAGYEVSRRTIQRDLKALAEVLPGLATDGNRDIPGWFWREDTVVQEVPVMDAGAALTFNMAETFLQAMFPPSVSRQLIPWFSCADKVLQELDEEKFARWGEKVCLLPRTQQLRPAEIVPEVTAVIFEALFAGRQIRVRYRRRDGDEAEYELHPLGLVFREAVVYLVATVWNYDDPRHFALHRFLACTCLEEAVVEPAGFSLQSYVAGGSFAYGGEQGELRLRLRFERAAGQHLLETPLSADQRVVSESAEELVLEATVQESGQLRWWLLGFGDAVTVLEPQALREEFAEIARGACRNYGVVP